ncbi:MAG: hypothetical protein ACOY6K_24325 [Pseudomonadota bacterium]
MRTFADVEDPRNVHSKSSFIDPVVGAGALAAIDVTALNAKVQRSRVGVIAQHHRPILLWIATSEPWLGTFSKAWCDAASEARWRT